jgi:hypothetical protein
MNKGFPYVGKIKKYRLYTVHGVHAYKIYIQQSCVYLKVFLTLQPIFRNFLTYGLYPVEPLFIFYTVHTQGKISMLFHIQEPNSLSISFFFLFKNRAPFGNPPTGTSYIRIKLHI